MSNTERILEAVRIFPGYSAGYYAAAAGITREQFRSIARRRLVIRRPGAAGWGFSYTAYYLPV